MTLGRRDVLRLGGITLMAGAGGLLQGGDAAAKASPGERRAELYALMGDLPDAGTGIRRCASHVCQPWQ